MNYRQGLKLINETMVSGGTGGAFTAASGTVDAGATGGSVGNIDSYAPNDPRNLFGADPKKKKNKKDKNKMKYPLYRRTFTELINSSVKNEEYDELQDIILECAFISENSDYLMVIKDILEKYNRKFLVEDGCVVLSDTDDNIQETIKIIQEILPESLFADGLILTLIGEMDLSNKDLKGKSYGMTVQDIADKHDVPVEDIEKQLEMGIKVEREHTPNKELARKIAMDHIEEFSNYYTSLKKMEDQLKKG